MILKYAMFIEETCFKEYDSDEDFVSTLSAQKFFQNYKYHIQFFDIPESATIIQLWIFDTITFYVKYRNRYVTDLEDIEYLNNRIEIEDSKYKDYLKQLGKKGRYDYEIKDYLESKL